jgi:hypothetical protein
MGWSFRRSKSFGLFRLNFSKSGVGFSFGVPGARIGISSKGKKYVRGGIPGTGLYYQQNLPDGHAEAAHPASGVSPIVVLIVLLIAGLIIYAMVTSSAPKPTTPAPVPQAVAPATVPVATKSTRGINKSRRTKHPHSGSKKVAERPCASSSTGCSQLR